MCANEYLDYDCILQLNVDPQRSLTSVFSASAINAAPSVTQESETNPVQPFNEKPSIDINLVQTDQEQQTMPASVHFENNEDYFELINDSTAYDNNSVQPYLESQPTMPASVIVESNYDYFEFDDSTAYDNNYAQQQHCDTQLPTIKTNRQRFD